MEFTRKTVLAFLAPLLEVEGLNTDDVFSITFEPGGVEFTVYDKDPDGNLKYLGDNIIMKAKFVNYLGSE